MFSWLATILFTLGFLVVGSFSLVMLQDDGGPMPIGPGIGLLAAPVALALGVCAALGWFSVLG